MLDDTKDPSDTTYSQASDDVKHQKSKPPSVTGEEDVFSGDMPQESADIDNELEKVGLHGDEEGVKPLGVKGQIDEEEE